MFVNKFLVVLLVLVLLLLVLDLEVEGVLLELVYLLLVLVVYSVQVGLHRRSLNGVSHFLVHRKLRVHVAYPIH